jgi:hypothetical protein
VLDVNSWTIPITDPHLTQPGPGGLTFVGAHIDAALLGGDIRDISGAVASTVQLTQNVLPIAGLVKICILSTACTQYIPMVMNQPTTVNGVPGTGSKGIGVGGLITAGGYGGVRLSIQGDPWTPKTVTIMEYRFLSSSTPVLITRTLWGFAHGPVSFTTSTAQPSGVVQLVTRVRVEANLPKCSTGLNFWSTRPGSNRRPPRWQGDGGRDFIEFFRPNRSNRAVSINGGGNWGQGNLGRRLSVASTLRRLRPLFSANVAVNTCRCGDWSL